MKILFLCKRFYTNKDLLSDRFGRLYHLPVELGRQGFNAGVLAIDYHHIKSDKIMSENVSIISLPAHPILLPLVPVMLLNQIKRFRPEVIIASGDSHIGFLGMLISRRLGCRFAFDIYDYYPTFKGNRIPGMVTMFKVAARKADMLFCASDPLKKVLTSLNNNCVVIENGVDLNLFRPHDMAKARLKLKLDIDIPIIGFFGTMAYNKGPILIDACRKLRREIPNLRLLSAGKVTGVDINEPWIDHRGELPQELIPELIAACNVLAVPLANHAQNNLSGSCKIAEYLACRKPVVATRISDIPDIFRQAPDSLCEPNAHDMALALKHQLDHPQITAFRHELSWHDISKKMKNELQNRLRQNA